MLFGGFFSIYIYVALCCAHQNRTRIDLPYSARIPRAGGAPLAVLGHFREDGHAHLHYPRDLAFKKTVVLH